MSAAISDPEVFVCTPRHAIVACAFLALLGMSSLGAPRPSSAGHLDIVIIVPNELATVEANNLLSFPFNIGSTPSMRYQQVYAASEFGALAEPGLITSIAFRPDLALGAAFAETLADVQINFSTTSASPDALSTTFASNVGVDDTIVFDGPLPMSSSFVGPPGGPNDFDVVIVLETPFSYDPSAGNLLLDVRNFAGGSTTRLDAPAGTGDSVSRLNSPGGTDGVADTTGLATSNGLVTQFTVPEPGAGRLHVVALAALAALAATRQPRPAAAKGLV